jgi:hypothetical protein
MAGGTLVSGHKFPTDPAEIAETYHMVSYFADRKRVDVQTCANSVHDRAQGRLLAPGVSAIRDHPSVAGRHTLQTCAVVHVG